MTSSEIIQFVQAYNAGKYQDYLGREFVWRFGCSCKLNNDPECIYFIKDNAKALKAIWESYIKEGSL